MRACMQGDKRNRGREVIVTTEPWAPPKPRRSPGRTALLAVGLFLALLAGIRVLAFAITTFTNDDDTATREEIEEFLIDEGLSPTVATCVADRQPEVADAESMMENNRFMSDLFTCSGMPAATGECAIDGLNEMMGHELSVDEFIAFEKSLQAEDRQAFAQITMVCSGYTTTEAACVTDGMAREFHDIFDQARLVLTLEQQARLEEIQVDCINDTPD